jgi:Rieske Fe-S protein
MFEGPKENKELELHKGWIALFVVIAVVLVVVSFRILARTTTKANAPAAATAAAAADPVKDLKIERATMQKDSLGTTAVWVITLANQSGKFTYSEITYQTQYVGADNSLIVQNQGTIPGSIAPNEEHSTEIRDTAYPTGTAWYRFKVTGAKAKLE